MLNPDMAVLAAALGTIGTATGFFVAWRWRRKAQFWRDMHTVEVAVGKSNAAALARHDPSVIAFTRHRAGGGVAP